MVLGKRPRVPRAGLACFWVMENGSSGGACLDICRYLQLSLQVSNTPQSPSGGRTGYATAADPRPHLISEWPMVEGLSTTGDHPASDALPPSISYSGSAWDIGGARGLTQYLQSKPRWAEFPRNSRSKQDKRILFLALGGRLQKQ